jgi:hypothetical protein
MQQLLVPLVVSVHLLFELSLLGLQFFFVQVSKPFSLARSLVLHIDHFTIDLLVSIVKIPLLIFYLLFKLLNFVFVLLKLFLGLSLDVGSFLLYVFAQSFNL